MYNTSKRIVDILLSSTALLLLFPVFLIVMLVLLLTGEKEVFYLQERVGFRNKLFKIIKFVTMVKNSPKIGTGSLTLRNDPRVLPFGKILRKTKINELPQIFNVLIGNMSIVGPRPQMEIDFEKFPSNCRKNIYKSKPGITGIGSIFFRDEEKWISKHKGNKHIFYKEKIAPYKANLEIWYLNNKSHFVDLKLIFITAWVIFFPSSNILGYFFNNLPTKPSYFN